MQLFDKNWLSFSVERVPEEQMRQRLVWRIADDVEIPSDAGISSIVRAVKRMKIGNNPVVALSGGVDSQCAALSLREAGVKFSLATMRYNDDLNSRDVENAQRFCDKHNFSLQIHDVDVVGFLRRESHAYATKYACSSPHFNTHFSFFEKLIGAGADTIFAGGQFPNFCSVKKRLSYSNSESQNAWTHFSSVNDFHLYGNFLGWSADIALPLTIAAGAVDCAEPPKSEAFNVENHERRRLIKYDSKITAMKKIGFDIVPQDINRTGFEEVKLFFERETGNVLMFEKAFRMPHEVKYPNYVSFLEKSHLDQDIAAVINR